MLSEHTTVMSRVWYFTFEPSCIMLFFKQFHFSSEKNTSCDDYFSKQRNRFFLGNLFLRLSSFLIDSLEIPQYHLQRPSLHSSTVAMGSTFNLHAFQMI
mmetsp:Transcript_7577/g.15921  ORF Transcript_7577/g.15921 Transcript_7577/m.15921 type:complete len:99 (-) Transcript_7577:847-1143(-)